MKKKLILGVTLLLIAIFAVGLTMAKPAEKAAKQCNDGIDNDGDGYKDYPSDPGCASRQDNSELNPNVQCDDGIDNNDADSLKDMNDPGCASPLDNNEVNGVCDDTTDNDGDTYADYPSDPGCTSYSDSSELGTVQCDDGVDNDWDNAVDYPDDGGCSSPSDNAEENCGDGSCYGFEESCDICVADCGYCDVCSDTDGGNYPFVFGYVYGYANSAFFNNSDYCTDASNIREYYCNETYFGDIFGWDDRNCGADGYGSPYCVEGPPYDAVYKNYNNYYCASGECDYTTTPTWQEWCIYGCTNGVCDYPDSCSDTDGGYYPFTWGLTYGYYNGEGYNSTDACVNSTWITENYCVGNYEYSDTFNCMWINATSCSNGACVW